MEPARKKEQIAASILFAFSVIYLLGCFPLKVGALSNPGCGLIPRLIGGLLLVFSSIYLYQAFWKKGSGKKAEAVSARKEKDYWAALGIAACVVAYPFLLRNLQFLLATFIAVFFMLTFMKYKTLVYSLLLSLIITVASFIVFSRLLGVVLPSGLLEQFLITLV